MGKAMVLLTLLFSLVCVTAAQGDTLILRRVDGNIYEMNAEVKYYIDGKFSVRLSSGEIRVFSINQVKEISFGSARETTEQQKKVIESLKKTIKGEPKTGTFRVENAHFKSLLEMISEVFEVNFKIIYSPDAYDSLYLPPELIKDRVTIYRENVTFEDLLEAIFSQTDFKYEMVQGPIVRVTLKDPSTKPRIKTQAKGPVKNEPDGFRGIKWGTDISTLGDMQYYKTSPTTKDIKSYRRKNDDLQLGVANLKSIDYFFWKGKFYSVTISTEGFSNYEKLKQEIFTRFQGWEEATEDWYLYNGGKTKMSLFYSDLSKLIPEFFENHPDKAILTISSCSLSKQMLEAYDRQKAKEWARIKTQTNVPKGTPANPVGKNRPFAAKFEGLRMTDKGMWGRAGQVEATITLLDVKRGSEAYSMIKNAYQFNDSPKAGKEYILAKVRFKVKSTWDNKASSIYGFEAVSGSGEVYDERFSVWMKTLLPLKGYPGATYEGWIAFQVKKTDSKPLMVFKRDDDGEVWFELY